MKKLTTNDFIEKANKKHNNFYEYSLTEYKNSRTNIKIICPVHGVFSQTPNNHLSGKGCSKCKGGIKLNTNDFIKKAIKKWGDRWNYSLVKYKNSNKKIKIICPVHGIFKQLPSNHLSGSGCPKCRKNFKLEKVIFIEKANKKHNNFYKYSSVNYINSFTKIEIICPKHGKFLQIPNSHLLGNGCSKCSNNKKCNTKEFIKKANNIWKGFYNYRLVNYMNNEIPIKIICPKHGIFQQKPSNHLSKKGCPKCKTSKGELKIINYLNKQKLKYYYQFKFEKLKNLRFDFYLPNHNTVIEYDGKQHFEPIKWFGGKESFKKQKERDKIKNLFCIKNSINMIRIPYWKKERIYFILNKAFNTHSSSS